ncbi:MAG: DUF3833 family protein [Sphingomonadales bacterium]|jgi:hypothetical protein
MTIYHNPLTPLGFFEGESRFEGFIQDGFGHIRRSYHGHAHGLLDGEKLSLEEHLIFNDGQKDERLWCFTPTDDGWRATAQGLIGEAEITTTGNDEMRWRYVMEVEVSGCKIGFHFEDVFIRITPNRLLAHTTMKKFGITVARLTSAYEKL